LLGFSLTITPALTSNLPSGWFIAYSDFSREANAVATIPLAAK